jgi:hypothetical protein
VCFAHNPYLSEGIRYLTGDGLRLFAGLFTVKSPAAGDRKSFGTFRTEPESGKSNILTGVRYAHADST